MATSLVATKIRYYSPMAFPAARPYFWWILAAALLAPCRGLPQTAPPEPFDDIARRAESLLDSKPREAMALYKQALALRPQWAEGWFYLGGASYRLEQYAEARGAFQRSIELNAGNGPAWAFLGLCEYELKNFDHALSNIERGEKLGLGSNAGFETAVRQRAALLLIRASLFDKAMAQLQPLTRVREQPPAVIEAAGLCALGTPGTPSELTPARRKVVMLAGRAQWAATGQRVAEAEPLYRELLGSYPNEPGVHYAHGLFLMESDKSAALDEFQHELRSNPRHWPSLLASAFLQTSSGDPRAAISSIQRAAKYAPEGYRWLCNAELGRAYLALNETAAAIPLFELAAKQEPQSAQTHFYLEQAFRRSGRKAEAAREHAEFVRIKAEQDPLSTPSEVAK